MELEELRVIGRELLKQLIATAESRGWLTAPPIINEIAFFLSRALFAKAISDTIIMATIHLEVLPQQFSHEKESIVAKLLCEGFIVPPRPPPGCETGWHPAYIHSAYPYDADFRIPLEEKEQVIAVVTCFLDFMERSKVWEMPFEVEEEYEPITFMPVEIPSRTADLRCGKFSGKYRSECWPLDPPMLRGILEEHTYPTLLYHNVYAKMWLELLTIEEYFL